MIKAQPNITAGDLEKILSAPVKSHPSQKIKFNLLIELLFETGARISELVCLRVKDVDIEENLLTFRNTKNGEDRMVPIKEEMTKKLERFISAGGSVNDFVFKGNKPDNHLSRITAFQSLKLRLKAAGIEKNIHPHSFRHAFITNKLRIGKPLPAVQKFVGHKSLQSTSQYVHFTMNDLREVLI